MKVDNYYCDICGEKIDTYLIEHNKLKPLEVPIYSVKNLKYNLSPTYEKRCICTKCINKIAERIFTLQIEKHTNKEEIDE